MTLLEDIKSGKYNLIFYIVTLIFFFHLYWMCTNKVEPMANLDDTQKNEVKDLIYSTYKIDVNAIKNLSEIANKLQKDGLTVPGNLTVTGNLTVSGDSITESGNFKLGNKDKTQWMFHSPPDDRGGLWISRVQRDGNVNWSNGLNLLTSTNGTTNTGGNFNLVPRGVVIAWTGTTPPEGWALCDGANGTPDLRGRFILSMGQGAGLTNRTINSKDGGEESVRLTIEHMPSHSHNYFVPKKYYYEFGGDDCRILGEPTLCNSGSNYNTDPTGEDKPHNNMPPFYVLAYIMKL